MAMMKGFVFTLDAIFSVVFATIAVSILIYIHYTSYSPAQFQVSQASAALGSLLNNSVSSMFNGSSYSKYLAGYTGTASYGWPQYGNDQMLSSSAPFGPTKPLLLASKQFQADIIPVVAVSSGHGLLGLTSNQIYIFNATTPSNGFFYNTGNALVSTPLIYGAGAIFATANGYVTSVSLSNSPVTLWSDNIGFNAITTPLDVEDNYLVFSATKASSGNSLVYFIYPSNGTVAAVDKIGASYYGIRTLAYDGTFLAGATYSNSITAGNVLLGIPVYGIGNYSSASSANSIGTVNGNYIMYSPAGAYSISVQLHSINTSLGGAAENGNYSFAVFSNDIAYSTPSSVFNYSVAGNSYNTTPSLAGSTGYMLIGADRFVGFDAPSRSQVFNISLPYDFYPYPFSDIALASGRAYVPDGNTLYVFGESTVPANTSALSALAGLYLGQRGGLADALLQSIYNSSGTGIFVGGTYAPSMYVAGFSGSPSSYILIPPGASTSPEATGHAMSMCEWYKINSLAGYNGLVLKGTAPPSSGNVPEYSIDPYGTELGFNITSSSGAVVASANAPGAVTGNDIGHWMFSCMSYNASTSTALYYLNGTTYTGTASNTLFATAGTGNLIFGAGQKGGSDVNMANVQMYGTNLTAVDMGKLYYSGVYGPPLAGRDLLSWWPLLGDGNDYYGSSVGFPYGVSYSSSGYTPSTLFNAYQISTVGAPIPVYSSGAYSMKNVSVVIWS